MIWMNPSPLKPSFARGMTQIIQRSEKGANLWAALNAAYLAGVNPGPGLVQEGGIFEIEGRKVNEFINKCLFI
jgi:hypothetical protein